MTCGPLAPALMQVHFCDPLIKQEESGDAACDRCQPTALRVCLHNCPDHFWRKRLATHSCTPMPSGRRRAGTNPVPARSYLNPDDRAIPWVQAAVSRWGQRSHRSGAGSALMIAGGAELFPLADISLLIGRFTSASTSKRVSSV